MDSHHVYILFSSTLDKYYIGYSSDVESRLKKHNQGYYDSAYTAQAHDWEIFISLPCNTKAQALRIEKHIKSMKSKIYLQNLKKHPEMRSKLIGKFTH